ncbi:MAG: lycopene cyclase domain-containing protein [Candidatus Gracilibacteria bacterium]
MPTKYLYLIGSLYFAFIALWMYYKMPKYRKAMLVLGLAIFWSGPVSEYFWMTKDWWHPETITGTIIGIEDFIFSFAHVIIPMFIYKLVFNKDTDRDFTKENISIKNSLKNLILWFIIPFSLSGILFGFFHINSVISVFIGMLLSCLILVILRKDLFIPSLWGAILMLIIALPAYLLLEFLSPGYIEKWWFMSKLTGILWLGIPIEDLLWYVIYGFMSGGAYEFIFNFKLIDRKTLFNS